jgi:hypothetical protein
MVDKKISVANIIKLMRECRKHNAYLNFNDLIIDCRASEKDLQIPNPQARGSAKKAQAAQVVTDKSIAQEQYNFATEMIETLHVEDPAAFETMLIQGELGEEKDVRRSEQML